MQLTKLNLQQVIADWHNHFHFDQVPDSTRTNFTTTINCTSVKFSFGIKRSSSGNQQILSFVRTNHNGILFDSDVTNYNGNLHIIRNVIEAKLQRLRKHVEKRRSTKSVVLTLAGVIGNYLKDENIKFTNYTHDFRDRFKVPGKKLVLRIKTAIEDVSVNVICDTDEFYVSFGSLANWRFMRSKYDLADPNNRALESIKTLVNNLNNSVSEFERQKL